MHNPPPEDHESAIKKGASSSSSSPIPLPEAATITAPSTASTSKMTPVSQSQVTTGGRHQSVRPRDASPSSGDAPRMCYECAIRDDPFSPPSCPRGPDCPYLHVDPPLPLTGEQPPTSQTSATASSIGVAQSIGQASMQQQR